jgi:hypothetical protein
VFIPSFSVGWLKCTFHDSALFFEGAKVIEFPIPASLFIKKAKEIMMVGIGTIPA